MGQLAPLRAIFFIWTCIVCTVSENWSEDCQEDGVLSLVQKRQTAKHHKPRSALLQQPEEEEEEKEEEEEAASSESEGEAEEPDAEQAAAESSESTPEKSSPPAELNLTNATEAELNETLMNTTTTQPDFYAPQVPAGGPINLTTLAPPKSTRPPTAPPPELLKPSIAEKVSLKGAFAEIIVMALYVFIGCGAMMNTQGKEGSAWVLQVSLTFGLANAVLSYAVDHWKVGNLNLVTTCCLMFLGQIDIYMGIVTIIAQLMGSCLGAYFLHKMIPVEKDCSEGLAHNVVQPGYKNGQVLVLEAAMTFILMFVTLQAALNPEALQEKLIARLSVGFAVFVGNSVLLPIDGCSMNPTRSFGPAFVAKNVRGQNTAFVGWWVFWFGPILGGLLGAGCFRLFADDLWWTLYA